MSKSRFINMAELTASKPYLKEYYIEHPTYINVSHINREEEVKTLMDIITYKVNTTHANPHCFYKNFTQPFSYAVAHYDNSGLIPYFAKMYHAKNSCFHRASIIALRYLKNKDIDHEQIQRHIMYLKNYPIAPERMGPKNIHTLNFNKIKDPFNRKMAETWVTALIMESNLALNTIATKLKHITYALNHYDKNCGLWTDDDVRICFNDILSMPIADITKQNRISAITSFFTYLAENKLILLSSAWLLSTEINLKITPNYKKTAPSEYVVSQLFNALEYADDLVLISFLILYTTGMRISELQSLKKDCLDIRDNATFIKYYQFKMKKEVSNVIPPNLVTMIQNYISSHPKKTEYLFENNFGQKIGIQVFRRRIDDFFKKQGVKNEDGTPYHFRAHSLRHLMAVRMHRYKIPYRYIQEQLHHDAPNMTLFYIEYMDNERIKKMTNWINTKGQSITPENLSLNIHKAQIETAILPNGLCTRPATLPTCQHCNTCLSCSYFTTSKEWLPTLKHQKDKLTGFIESAKRQGWNRAVVNSQRTLDLLKNIISNLEVR